MEVVAVSQSQPQWVDIRGTRTFTSIVRKPFVDRLQYIELDSNGVRDNKTAAHDGPVYGFFAEHYEYWTRQLEIDRSTWDWCHWGENITLRSTDSRFTEHNLHLGDIWAIGDHVQLEVCGARIPCFKLAWRCGQKDQWLKPLSDSGFVGAYFRVRQSGRIHPGDKCVLLHKSDDQVSVAMISRIAFDTSLTTKDTIDLLSRNEKLLRMNRWLMQRKLTQLNDKLEENKNAWEGWRPYRVQRIIYEGGDVKSFYLAPLDGKPLANYKPGQFLTLRLPGGKIRNWTISDWHKKGEFSYYRISIKRAADASVWMWDECTHDSIVEVRSPAGRFVLDWSQTVSPRQIYFSAGIGITPILAMLKAHSVHNNLETTPGLWIHVARNSDSFPLGAEWSDVLQHALIRRVVFFTKPTATDVQGIHYDYAGRPTSDILAKLIGKPYFLNPLGISDIEMEGKLSSVYICGPTSFHDSVREHLQLLDIPSALIHSEAFGGTNVVETSLESALVRFTTSGVSGKWHRSTSQTLLELAESLGLDPPFGCRVGACGSCSAKLRCGSVNGGLQLNGAVLICSAKPTTAKVEIEL